MAEMSVISFVAIQEVLNSKLPFANAFMSPRILGGLPKGSG
jgi:hypothetical protein